MQGKIMINISALINDLSASQNSFYMIKEFNKCIDNTDLSVGVFCNRHCVPVIQPLFACRLANFLVSYNGIVIATTLEEAEIILKLPNKSSRYLYLWDLDWLENPVFFSSAMNILRDDKLQILARSESHAKVIDNFANREVKGIIDNWNIDQVLKLCT